MYRIAKLIEQLPFLQIKAKCSDPEEIPMVTNIHCEDFSSVKRQQTESTSGKYEANETSKSGQRTNQLNRQSTLVKWTYPEILPKHFHVYAEYTNKMGVTEKKFIGQTRSCNFFVSNAVLDQIDPPVHIEIVPISPYHRQKETRYCKMFINLQK